MNRPLSIVEALKGNARPVVQLPWQYTCPQCGRDNGMAGGPPLSIRCVGFGCDAVIEAEENENYVKPVSMMTLARAE